MSDKEQEIHRPLLNSATQSSEVTVSHIYKISKEQLRALFADDSLGERLQELRGHGSTNLILKNLATEASTGIVGDEKDLRRRKNVFGKNLKPLPQRASLLESIKEQFKDKLWWIVIFSAVLSCICGWAASDSIIGLAQGVSIIAAVLLIICIASWADWFKDTRFVKLQETILDMTVPVIRGKFGNTMTVSVWDIVVGDIILLKAGDRVTADCLIIESADLVAEQPQSQVNTEEDENAEPQQENKSAVDAPGGSGDPFLYADCLIVRGQCKAVVCNVGTNSSRGDKKHKLETDVDTKLQHKLKNLANRFTIYALIAALAVFLVLIITMIITLCSLPKDDKDWVGLMFSKLAKDFNVCVILLIVSIPEGLPLTVGVSLAFSVRKMLSDQILIRKLDGPEKMGEINEIVTSKTGTLTKGNMKVGAFYVENREIKNSRASTFKNCDLKEDTIRRIQDSILYNTDARVEMDATTYVPVGSGTEKGLIRFLQDAGIPVHLLIQRKLGRIRCVGPFDSTTKRSLVALEDPSDPSKICIYLKGAPEVIINHCTHIVGNNGDIEHLSDSQRNDFTKADGIIATMAAQPLHVLGFAYMEMDLENWTSQFENSQQPVEKALEEALDSNQLSMIYLTTFGMKDQLRDVVYSCIKDHIRNEGGINVTMVSGDHLETAKAVALKAGILDEEDMSHQYSVMTADQFRELVGNVNSTKNDEGEDVLYVENESTFGEVVSQLKVLARASATDKHTLVVGLQAMGRIVAATGEGINDIQALQRADVGLAMGSGCAAAKEASSLVLLDDDIQASLKSLMWGRNIFHNVARFLQFQITVNISVCYTVFIGCIFFSETPISPVALLWINLIMDTFAALALATEPPLKNVISSNPHKKGSEDDKPAAILAPHVWRQILGVSILNMIIMTIMVFFGSLIGGYHFTNATSLTVAEPDHFNPTLKYDDQTPEGMLYIQSQEKGKLYSYILNTFVFLQITNEINCRKVGPHEYNVFQAPFHNLYYIIVWLGTIVGQVLIVQWIPSFFSVVPLSKGEWGTCMIISLTPLLFGLIFKFTPDTWPQKICCNRLPDEDENVDDHPVLKGWNKAQSSVNKPSSNNDAHTGDEGMEMEPVAHDEDDEEGNPDGDYKAM